ncbi:MAG: ATP-binding cassette domain-containing protein [Geminicoccaceae bacterium]|nr:ATP-binding cassette domain-containing protein [Geminicoccaceae bacterium]
MRPLLRILGLFWRTDRKGFVMGIVLMVTVAVMGAMLLGLSGWFITACGLAGAAGAGMTFDVFRPSAGIRFLALGRTAARYGERLATHDATLRFLAGLRVALFRGLAARPFPEIESVRRAVMLHRLTADVDALDSIYLRMVAPVAAALATLLLAAIMLGWLVDPWIASWVCGVHASAAAVIVLSGARAGGRPAKRRAMALEALRIRLVDLARGRTVLAVSGRIPDQERLIGRADRAAAQAAVALDAVEQRLGGLQRCATALAAAGALLSGDLLGVPVTRIAIAVFTALALGEATAPLRRGALEAGRAMLAARRISVADGAGPGRATGTDFDPAGLHLDGVSFRRGARPVLSGLTLSVAKGEWVALSGASGCGKSTVLALAAGLLEPESGTVTVGRVPVREWAEADLRGRVAFLSQHSALFAGTVAENLRLAAPDACDDLLWRTLDVVALSKVVAARGGLGLRLGEGGAGLSGGEARRLALARIVLRRPAIALLDEPTEGLDTATAAVVLARLRSAFAGVAVLAASHRQEEISIADRVYPIG